MYVQMYYTLSRKNFPTPLLTNLLKSICLWTFRVLGEYKGKETNPRRPEVIGAAAALHDHSY